VSSVGQLSFLYGRVREAITLSMRPLRVDRRLAERLLGLAEGGRWGVTPQAFAEALAASAGRVFGDRDLAPKELERFCAALHLPDLALAIACAEGHEAAWEHFVREYRVVLYRSADAIDAAGGARELADSLYAELYGLDNRGGSRGSLFRYYHGRSSLATWLRAVLAQRHIDRLRAQRRVEPLSDLGDEVPASGVDSDPDCPRLLSLVKTALTLAVMRLSARDRLRLASYYAQGLKLAEVGRITGEHEATVSRQLARTRRALRDDIEHYLRYDIKLSDAEIVEGFRCAMNDAGPMDLGEMLNAAEVGKQSAR
jgi:RNA polymerase sigma factor (sigma-70 family)